MRGHYQGSEVGDWIASDVSCEGLFTGYCLSILLLGCKYLALVHLLMTLCCGRGLLLCSILVQVCYPSSASQSCVPPTLPILGASTSLRCRSGVWWYSMCTRCNPSSVDVWVSFFRKPEAFMLAARIWYKGFHFSTIWPFLENSFDEGRPIFRDDTPSALGKRGLLPCSSLLGPGLRLVRPRPSAPYWIAGQAMGRAEAFQERRWALFLVTCLNPSGPVRTMAPPLLLSRVPPRAQTSSAINGNIPSGFSLPG